MSTLNNSHINAGGLSIQIPNAEDRKAFSRALVESRDVQIWLASQIMSWQRDDSETILSITLDNYSKGDYRDFYWVITYIQVNTGISQRVMVGGLNYMPASSGRTGYPVYSSNT